MGAESSSLDECSLENPIIQAKECQWEVRHGITFQNDSHITIFSDKSKNRESTRLFERNVKFLKSLRHPQILHYIRDGKNEDRFLVTEKATPLPLILEDLSSLELASGICNIISALSFLHDKANICHNNICADSIFVTENGSWKLGGFECACRYSETSPDFLKSISKFRKDDGIPPEEKEDGLNLTAEFGHVRDVYAFGVFVDSLLEQIDDLGDIIKTFELRIQDECLNSDPKKRLKLNTFLEDKIFSNDLLSLSTFLYHITLKDSKEREEFYRTLLPRLQSLPMLIIGKHLVKPLLCRFVLLDKTARDFVAPHILIPHTDSTSPQEEIIPLLSEELYKTYVIPELYKAFCCHEINIRMLLLKYFHFYAHLFDKEKLEDVIFPQILLGIRDTNEELAALSLHCLADMVPILGRDIIIGGKSKSYFTEGLPKNIDANLQVKEPGRNVNGFIGKVKLKDLAGNSSNYVDIKKTPPMERKSREDRLKEQRERREQKRLERENRKNIHGKEKDEKEHNSFEKDLKEPVDRIDPVIEKVQPEVFCQDEDDWSDWEDQNKDTHDDRSDKSHDRQSSPIHYNKFDTINRETGHSSYHEKDFEPIDSTHLKSDKEMSDNSFSLPKSDGKFSQKKSGMSLKGKVKSVKPKTDDKPLGAEFDINSVEIKVQEKKEMDFFSDMMPEIKPTNLNNELLLLGASKSDTFPKTENQSTNPVKSALFTYSEPETDKDTGTAGWGDDDWDVEGF